ncbi:BamA/TamA family outer membrane protein [Vibrio sp. DW001]|uniref:BamA/TamA family outer membrane protein n=1 Tax=Vibrio sp. DW001 TaxID=2912315 RepID=UPI0023B0E422|nr:BamA/TamA family outer membrane protein [Vibrio sp. DW001]WED28904.1 BamA/TamA family outer membrane protein [Vibrio sp. DW001]
MKTSVLSLSIGSILASLNPYFAHATSFTDSLDGYLDMGEYLAENAYGFLPVPIIITEPAIGYGAGFIGVFLHESDDQKEKRKELAAESVDGGAQLLTPAISAVGGFKTDNGTWIAFAGHRRSWNQDQIRYQVGAGYGDIKMTFYNPNGSRNLELDRNKNGVTLGMEGAMITQQLQFRVNDTPLFLGVSQLYVSPEFSLEGNSKVNELVSQWANTTPEVSGFGLIAEYDSKNSFLYPTDGYNYKAEYTLFRKSIGSDYDYDTFNIKGLNYWPIVQDWTFALKAQYKSLSNDDSYLPPPAYPDIEMRGIARNRYQGNYTASIESQVMWQITSRWATSVFGGLGSATQSAGQLFDTENYYSYGTGIRYTIARRYGLRSGIDIAFSEEDTAIYFQVGTGL